MEGKGGGGIECGCTYAHARASEFATLLHVLCVCAWSFDDALAKLRLTEARLLFLRHKVKRSFLQHWLSYSGLANKFCCDSLFPYVSFSFC